MAKKGWNTEKLTGKAITPPKPAPSKKKVVKTPTPPKSKTTSPKQSMPPVLEKPKKGRPKNDIEKVPFTTSVRPEYIKKIKMAALDKGGTTRPADILDEILSKYFR